MVAWGGESGENRVAAHGFPGIKCLYVTASADADGQTISQLLREAKHGAPGNATSALNSLLPWLERF